VTLLNRLRQASDWFRWLAREIVSNHHPVRIDLTCPEWLDGYQVKSIDATVVSQPGSTGTDWRLHYCIDLFDLFGWLGSLEEGIVSEQYVCIKGGGGDVVRLIGIRKNEQASLHARKKYRAKMSRRQAVIHKQTEQLQDYVLVLTRLTDPAIQPRQVLQLHRLRWQIEIAFKRLKSLIGLGHLPKYDPQSCRAWLHGKLFIALLVDLMVEEARLFSPWGYPLQGGHEQSPLSMEGD